MGIVTPCSSELASESMRLDEIFFFLGASESMSWTILDEGFGINEEARA